MTNKMTLHRTICTAAICLSVLTGCPDIQRLPPRSPQGESRTVSTSDELTRLTRAVDDLTMRVEHLAMDLKVIAATSQCKPEVQSAFNDLRALCLKGVCIRQTGSTGVLIEEAGGFTKLLQTLPHEVVYFDANSLSINPERKKLLSRLASQTLPSTQFMVLAFVDIMEKSATAGQTPEKLAAERADTVLKEVAGEVQQIIKLNLVEKAQFLINSQKDPTEKQVMIDRLMREKANVDYEYRQDNSERFLKGILDVPLTLKTLRELRPTDLPQSTFHEPSNKLKRSVWVFRVNC
ncbi:MAG: hypothetical protein U1A78_37975 [Polyangia bacterium]